MSGRSSRSTRTGTNSALISDAIWGSDRQSTRLNSRHTEIYTLSLHDALPIYALDRRLIAARDVRSLVAVDAHGDEQRVDQRRDLGIGVDRAVAFIARATVVTPDVQEDGAIELRRERERFTIPGLPVDRLACRAREITRLPFRSRPRHSIGEGLALGEARGTGDGSRAEKTAMHAKNTPRGRDTFSAILAP